MFARTFVRELAIERISSIKTSHLSKIFSLSVMWAKRTCSREKNSLYIRSQESL